MHIRQRIQCSFELESKVVAGPPSRGWRYRGQQPKAPCRSGSAARPAPTLVGAAVGVSSYHRRGGRRGVDTHEGGLRGLDHRRRRTWSGARRCLHDFGRCSGNGQQARGVKGPTAVSWKRPTKKGVQVGKAPRFRRRLLAGHGRQRPRVGVGVGRASTGCCGETAVRCGLAGRVRVGGSGALRGRR